MYDVETMERLVTLSGGEALGYSWPERGGSRIPGNIRRLWRLDMHQRQEATCPECGTYLDLTVAVGDDDAVEACHMVSRGIGVKRSDDGRGWVPCNIALGHRRCNRAQQARGSVVHPDTLARPDLVPSEWTPFTVLRAALRHGK